MAKVTGGDVDRIVIEPCPSGAFLFVFESPASSFPERDYLFENVEEAKRAASEDYGAFLWLDATST